MLSVDARLSTEMRLSHEREEEDAGLDMML